MTFAELQEYLDEEMAYLSDDGEMLCGEYARCSYCDRAYKHPCAVAHNRFVVMQNSEHPEPVLPDLLLEPPVFERFGAQLAEGPMERLVPDGEADAEVVEEVVFAEAPVEAPVVVEEVAPVVEAVEETAPVEEPVVVEEVAPVEETVTEPVEKAAPIASYVYIEEPRPHVITVQDGRKDWRLLILNKRA